MKLSNHAGNEYENCAGNGLPYFGNGSVRPHHNGNGGTVVPINFPGNMGNGNIFVRNAATGYVANNGHYIAAYQTSYGPTTRSYGPYGIGRDSICVRDTSTVFGNRPTSYELPDFINSESVSIGLSTEEGFRHPLGHYISLLADPSRLSIMATEKLPDQPAVITTTTVTSQTTTTKKMTSSSSIGLTFDKSFAMSPQGVLAAIEAFYSLVAFIVVAAGDRYGYKSGSYAFFMTVTFIVFFFTLCYYIGEITHLRYKIQLPWTILDMVVYSTYIVALLISSSLVAANGYSPSHGAGATLGFVVMQLYMISLVLTIMAYRARQSANQQSMGATSGTLGVDNAGNTIGASNPDNFYPGPAY